MTTIASKIILTRIPIPYDRFREVSIATVSRNRNAYVLATSTKRTTSTSNKRSSFDNGTFCNEKSLSHRTTSSPASGGTSARIIQMGSSKIPLS